MFAMLTIVVILSVTAIFLHTKGSTDKTEETTVSNDPVLGVLTVKNGYQLERDIIPQLSSIYIISDDEVKAALEKAKSSLIDGTISDYKKMEGIILPGTYYITEKDIDTQIQTFIKETEYRYENVIPSITTTNDLTPKEKLTLASIVEAECLKGEYYQQVADIFLNRLNEGSKLQSCVTAEYALGYQRPYLTLEDILVDNPYNTYNIAALPPGPICSFSDASLKVASGNSINTSLMYFYYDYIEGSIHAFADYDEFSTQGAQSMSVFESQSSIGKFDQINKQEVYGK